MTLVWAEAENVMVILLSRILMNDPAASMASTLYFSINNLDGRIGMVDAAFRFIAERVPDPEKTLILKLWGSLHNQIQRLKRTRNTVAHGQIITVARRNVNKVRLSSPMFDFNRHAAAHAARQFPGLSANDIENSITSARAMNERIDQFREIAEMVTAGDMPALRKKLAELEDQFQMQKDA